MQRDNPSLVHGKGRKMGTVYWSLDTGSTVVIILATVVVLTSAEIAMASVQQPIFTELFDTEFRYSGAGFAYQFTAAVGGGLTPADRDLAGRHRRRERQLGRRLHGRGVRDRARHHHRGPPADPSHPPPTRRGTHRAAHSLLTRNTDQSQYGVRSTERDVPVSVIGRVSSVFDAFTAEDSELRVGEIARRTGLAKATASRLVAELVEHGFLERSGQAVRVGLRFFELGQRAARPQELRRLALANMADLRSATRQTVHLGVLDGTEVVYVVILRSRTAPPMGSRVGGRLPAHATGVGKALLAWAEPEVVDAVVAAGLPAVGPRTITDDAALRTELAAVRERGVAYEREESGPGVLCAAAPIRPALGSVIAALSVSTGVGEVDPVQLGMAVQTSANALGREAARNPAFARLSWADLR
jgi:IclR family transcriptional regulator, acetate operon repressor